MSEYEVYAIRYGSIPDRQSHENFIGADPHDQSAMPLDYFVWVIRNNERTYVVDTGFSPESGAQRGRRITRPIREGLQAIGVEPASVADVILTHMHYDHAGNHHLFPNARYHVQESEMRYCTGACMCHAMLRHPFQLEDVQAMVGRVFEGRVQFHDGASEIAPGLSVHWVGGHTQGLQVVRVRTKRGWVVLASDATHYYANFLQRRPFPLVVDVKDMLNGFDTLTRLAESPDHVIPGHDPEVLTRYPLAGKGDGIVRLDIDG